MKRIINLIYLCFAVLLSSCFLIDADYIAGSVIYFANDSSHDIYISDFPWPDNEEFPEGIYLKPNDVIMFKSVGYEVSSPDPLDSDHSHISECKRLALPKGAIAVFDNKYAITYSQDGEHRALCEVDNYIPSRYKANWWDFTYLFTDEDYEYARKHGEVIE